MLLTLQAQRRRQLAQRLAVCRQQLGVLSEELLQGAGVAGCSLRMQLLQLQRRQVQAQLLQLLRCCNAVQLLPSSGGSRQQREALLCLQGNVEQQCLTKWVGGSNAQHEQSRTGHSIKAILCQAKRFVGEVWGRGDTLHAPCRLNPTRLLHRPVCHSGGREVDLLDSGKHQLLSSFWRQRLQVAAAEPVLPNPAECRSRRRSSGRADKRGQRKGEEHTLGQMRRQLASRTTKSSGSGGAPEQRAAQLDPHLLLAQLRDSGQHSNKAGIAAAQRAQVELSRASKVAWACVPPMPTAVPAHSSQSRSCRLLLCKPSLRCEQGPEPSPGQSRAPGCSARPSTPPPSGSRCSWCATREPAACAAGAARRRGQRLAQCCTRGRGRAAAAGCVGLTAAPRRHPCAGGMHHTLPGSTATGTLSAPIISLHFTRPAQIRGAAGKSPQQE